MDSWLLKRLLRAFALFIFFLALPIYFFGSFFNMQSEVLVVAGVAFFIPCLLAFLAKRSRIRIAPADDLAADPSPPPDLPPQPPASPKVRTTRWLDIISHNSANTWYQNLLIIFSCIVYVRACYSLKYVDEAGEGDFTYYLDDTPFNLSAFEIAECFLAVTFGFDLFMRVHFGKDKYQFQLNTYFFVDMLAFASYLATAQMAPTATTKVHLYNAYVGSGIFRFLRLRKTLKKLDIYEKQRDVVVKFYTKTYVLTWRSAGMIILALQVGQYILSSCSMIMFAEFPCMLLEPEHCNENFHYFHRTLYFIVVTLSTVGYGDMSPCTDFGVVVLTLIVVIGALNVPLAVQQFHNLWLGGRVDETAEEIAALHEQTTQILKGLDVLERLAREEEKLLTSQTTIPPPQTPQPLVLEPSDF